ncbi:LysM peptidoglycan-binding domain-containing protein [Jejudonia soesokkakensis]|uniref:LysM peptidoglycan-binding domain-containing protein n=1 Tax=Jejudonia soesokkakensis TaxID=1323432 RepID=A0ABW2MTB7_9FLAO
MKYFIYLSLLFVLCDSCTAAVVQQNYQNHTVKKGETIFSISQTYGVSEATIYKFNPDTKQGVREGAVLVLPTTDLINTTSDSVTFKMHKVKRKETLFSISQTYNVSQDDLKKYNKELYARQLKKGEKIRIPVTASVVTTNTSNNTETSNNTTNVSENKATHTVKAKETMYGIARMYGITIPDLQKLNPGLGENVTIGTVLNIPSSEKVSTSTIDTDEFDYYEVQPKEGFYRLKVKLGLTEAQIIELNPYAKDGLKDGMILKIPKEVAESVADSNVQKIDLESIISNRSKKKIAVLLPFQLNKATSDSTSTNVDLIKKNATVRVALDFYSGVLMAAEFAKDKGISIEIDVYDTDANEGKTRSIINGNDFEDTDAVIGPLLRKNVEIAADELKRDNIPVFSPLSNREIEMKSNLFQTLPTDKMLRKKLFSYLKDNEANKNFLVIADPKKGTQKSEILSAFPQAKTVNLRKDAFLYVQDIDSKLDKTKENWIILESENPVLVSNVVGLLNGMPSSNNLRLFTFDKNDAYDYNDVSNLHLAKLNFTFPSVNKSYNHNDKNAFLISYKNEYGVLPNKYAVRGFDVTYDVLLRLAIANDIYDSMDSDYETEYIENKFRYTKRFLSGYENEAVYLVKYNKDLLFEEVE